MNSASKDERKKKYIPNPDYTEIPKDGKYICACCKNYVFDRLYSYDFCPICGWQDGDIQNIYMNIRDCNHMTLAEAQEAYRRGKPVK